MDGCKPPPSKWKAKHVGDMPESEELASFQKEAERQDFSVRQAGPNPNSQVQVETIVRLLLDPVERRQRQKLLGLLEVER